MNWMPSATLNAQVAHFFIAMYVMAQVRTWKWRKTWAFGLVIVFALAKEFVFDILVERDTWAGSWLDYSLYMVGMVFGYYVQRWKGGWEKVDPMD